MDHFAAVKLLCLEQKDNSLKKPLEEFLSLVPATSFPDNCLCSSLYAGLNTATKEQLSGEGPRGSFARYIEWVLMSCDSPLTVDIIDDDTSPTSYPVPSQHPDCGNWQHEPTAGCERDFAVTFEPESDRSRTSPLSLRNVGLTRKEHTKPREGLCRDVRARERPKQNITTEPKKCGSDQVCEPGAPSVAEGVLVEFEGMVVSPANPPTTESEFLASTWENCFDFGEVNLLPVLPSESDSHVSLPLSHRCLPSSLQFYLSLLSVAWIHLGSAGSHLLLGRDGQYL
ncbi:hypothetical protein DPX16_6052 [Anabarilius grahami]|uniref:Uncharacterized protein n=1 Tax=Anabarilius grahami TaxID=495550 RepID=A0A3N0Z0U8_ANAGA|nr:hypothetical protein DPX16_6052 [Anabarilius grahami]